MHVLINKDRCVFLGKHQDENALLNLSWLESPNTACAVLKCDVQFELDTLTDYELKHLYRNTCGVDHIGFSRDALLTVVHELLQRMPESDFDKHELQSQCNSVDRLDLSCYKYVKGSTKPEKLVDLFEPDPVIVARNLENESAAVAAAPLVKQQYIDAVPAYVPKHTASTPNSSAATRTPRVPSDGPSEAPKAGSKTGRVWEIADVIYIQSGQSSDFKTLRRQIVEACEAEGINSSTASVQFGKWKHTKS
jgi:hypothetical protein